MSFKSIFITGSNGFVGKQIIELNSHLKFTKYKRGNKIIINEPYVFHFAGLAHNSNKSNKRDEYINANYILTKKIFNAFKKSQSTKIFIFLSTSKVSGLKNNILVEHVTNNNRNMYSESKLMAEKFLLNQIKNIGNKKIYIIRPSIIIGKNMKGNLKYIKKIVKYNLIWPFGKFDNKISILDIRNLNHVLLSIINNKISSGIYNLSNSNPIKVTELVFKINYIINKKTKFFFFNRSTIKLIFTLGNFFNLPFLNLETFRKITENNIVSNKKIIDSIGQLPFDNDDGLKLYFNE